MRKQMLKSIGVQLGQKGQCPYDSGCRYAKGVKCSAPREELPSITQTYIEERMKNIMGIGNWWEEDNNPWPCTNIFIVQFIDPSEEV